MTDTIASLTVRIAALEAALREVAHAPDRDTPNDYNRGWNDSRYRLRAVANAALHPPPDDRAKVDVAEECARIAAEEADEQDGAEGYLAAKTVEDRIRARFGRPA